MVVKFKNQQARGYLFGEFRLEPDKRLLTKNGAVIRLGNKPFQVLLYLIEHRHRVVPRSELLDVFWDAKDVYDDTLRKSVGAIRKALDENSSSPSFIETHYGDGYRYIGSIEEYLLEEEGVSVIEIEKTRVVKVITEEEDLPTPLPTDSLTITLQPIAQIASRTQKLSPALLVLALIAAIALSTMVIILSGRKTTRTPNQPPFLIHSIAVLPLENLSNDSDNEYFTDGLTETFITELSKIKGLKVISRASVFTYKGKEIDPHEVGNRLGVEAILEGSVSKSRDTVRVETRLVSAEDGRVLWVGNTFDRSLKDLFAVQDEISCSLAASLKVAVCGEARTQFGKRGTENVAAYEALLKARYFYNQRTPEGLKKAIQYAEEAVKLDPRYATAYANVAGCYLMGIWYIPLDPKEAIAKAKQAATKALEIDDASVEAHEVMAIILGYEWYWSGSKKEWQRVFELNPAYTTYGYAYTLLRENPDEAVRWMRQAQELDPLSLLIRANTGQILYYARRYDEAIDQLKSVIELDPNYAMAHTHLGQVYTVTGKYDAAIEELQMAASLSEQSPEILATLAQTYAAAGKHSEAQKMLNQLAKQATRSYISPYMLSRIYAALEQKDFAFTMLEKAFQEHDSHLIDLAYDPMLDPLRTDLRYGDLLHLIRM